MDGQAVLLVLRGCGVLTVLRGQQVTESATVLINLLAKAKLPILGDSPTRANGGSQGWERRGRTWMEKSTGSSSDTTPRLRCGRTSTCVATQSSEIIHRSKYLPSPGKQAAGQEGGVLSPCVVVQWAS